MTMKPCAVILKEYLQPQNDDPRFQVLGKPLSAYVERVLSEFWKEKLGFEALFGEKDLASEVIDAFDTVLVCSPKALLLSHKSIQLLFENFKKGTHAGVCLLRKDENGETLISCAYLLSLPLLIKTRNDYLKANGLERKIDFLKWLDTSLKKEAGGLLMVPAAQKEDALVIEDFLSLGLASKITRNRINESWMRKGVAMEDPDSTYIGLDVEIGEGCVLRPQTTLLGKTRIGNNNIIGPSSFLENVIVGDGNVIDMSHITDSEIGNGSHLGPYLNVRGGSKIGNDNILGNFNDIKNVVTGDGVFCCHLSYLGDSTIGDRVNVGAGTIIANYDGVNKFRSNVEDDAFLGSGSILISPVTIGDHAFIAAGSTINSDVPPHAMGIARARQINKDGFADTFKEKALEKKNGK